MFFLLLFFPHKSKAIRFWFHIILSYLAEIALWPCQLCSIIPGADFTRQKALEQTWALTGKKENDKKSEEHCRKWARAGAKHAHCMWPSFVAGLLFRRQQVQFCKRMTACDSFMWLCMYLWRQTIHTDNPAYKRTLGGDCDWTQKQQQQQQQRSKAKAKQACSSQRPGGRKNLSWAAYRFWKRRRTPRQRLLWIWSLAMRTLQGSEKQILGAPFNAGASVSCFPF